MEDLNMSLSNNDRKLLDDINWQPHEVKPYYVNEQVNFEVVKEKISVDSSCQTDFDELPGAPLNLFFCTFYPHEDVATYCNIGLFEKNDALFEPTLVKDFEAECNLVESEGDDPSYSPDDNEFNDVLSTNFKRGRKRIKKEHDSENSFRLLKKKKKMLTDNLLKVTVKGLTKKARIKKGTIKKENRGRKKKLLNNDVKCKHCDLVFPDLVSRRAHTKTEHKPKPKGEIKCEICLTTFSQLYNLNRHIDVIHKKTPRVSCKYCDKTFSRKDFYQHHLQNVHKNDLDEETKKAMLKKCGKYKCDGCKRFFARRRNFLDHTNADLKCSSCELPFSCKTALRIHFNKCAPKVMTLSGGMTPEGGFPCDICGKVSIDKKSLYLHKKYHDPKFECDQCHKKFAWKCQLKAHESLHTGERPYVCEICNHTFAHPVLLKRHHYSVHTLSNKVKVQCSLCPKAFPCKAKLIRHMTIHTQEKPFVCEICGSAYTQAGSLKSHVQSIHGIEDPMRPDDGSGPKLLKYKRPKKPKPAPVPVPTITTMNPVNHHPVCLPQNIHQPTVSTTMMTTVECHERLANPSHLVLNKIQYIPEIVQHNGNFYTDYDINYQNI